MPTMTASEASVDMVSLYARRGGVDLGAARALLDAAPIAPSERRSIPQLFRGVCEFRLLFFLLQIIFNYIFLCATVSKCFVGSLTGVKFLLTGIAARDMPTHYERRMEELITAHGGTLISDGQFDKLGGDALLHSESRRSSSTSVSNAARGAIDHDVAPDVVLLSPKPQRTAKYLVALARHVPCCHYLWLAHSIARSAASRIGAFLLPAAILDDDVLPSPLLRVASPYASARALDDVRVEVNGVDAFRKNWLRVLDAAGARCDPSGMRLVMGRPLDVAVVCDAPSEHILSAAAAQRVPVVGVDWIVASIALCRRADAAEARFRYDWRVTRVLGNYDRPRGVGGSALVPPPTDNSDFDSEPSSRRSSSTTTHAAPTMGSTTLIASATLSTTTTATAARQHATLGATCDEDASTTTVWTGRRSSLIGTAL